jgi:16S rRNA (cytosine967-C5)-methyltransferase
VNPVPPESFEGLVPPVRGYDERLLARAAAGGRIRGTAVELIAALRERPLAADATLRHGLRQARQLHSAERRFVSDLAYDYLRHHQLAERAFGLGIDAFFDGWLDAQRHGDHAWIAAARTVPADAVLGVLGSLSPDFAEALRAIDDPFAFLAASNQRAALFFRVNRGKATREALIERLANEGVETHPGVGEDALRVARAVDVHTLASFREGWFEVQDEGSQRVGQLAAHGTRIVDFCAGAGGKALQIASLRPEARILACDVRAAALDTLRERANRAGVRQLQTRLLRENHPSELDTFRNSADTVLVDAPCTGSGTLRRHPELRFRIDRDEVERMRRLQRNILARAADLVRPGGRLVYATCSVLPTENEDTINAFLAEHSAFQPDAPPLRLRPDRDDSDAFFAQVLHRA